MSSETRTYNDGNRLSNEVTRIGGDEIQHVTGFADDIDPYVITRSGERDDTAYGTASSEVQLRQFLCRPTLIATINTQTGGFVDSEINPWLLFFSNPIINRKIQNYKQFRGRLNVKFIINGNEFMYGAITASYLPLSGYDKFSEADAAGAGWRFDFTQYSQCMTEYLSVTHNIGGQMQLPFMWHEDAMDLEAEDLANAGIIFIKSLNRLTTANGDAQRVDINVLAWMDSDFTLMGTTIRNGVPPSNNILRQQPVVAMRRRVNTIVRLEDLTKQGEIQEVNKNGVISAPASWIASAAGALKAIPYIGKYAMVTEIGAGAVARIARAFGYSRPVLTKEPDKYIPRPLGNLALTTVADSSLKLAFDDMQELTIDPIIADLKSNDNMAIPHIVAHDSYLHSYEWNETEQSGKLLFAFDVHPSLCQLDEQNRIRFTAPGGVAYMHDYWRGSLQYRIMASTAAKHKGRIAIVYDPRGIDVSVPFEQLTTANYTKIVDITSKTDFVFDAPLYQKQAWRRVTRDLYEVFDNAAPPLVGTFEVAKQTTNGQIGVYVMNELACSGTESATCFLNLFVRGGEDLEFHVMSPRIAEISPGEDMTPQSPPAPSLRELEGLEKQGELKSALDVETDDNENAQPSDPHPPTTLAMGTARGRNVTKVYMGESINSLRSLIKRYCYHWTCYNSTGTPGQGNVARVRIRECAYPFYRGSQDGALWTNGHNYCNTVPLQWVTLMFQGWRGSIRHKFAARGVSGPSNLFSMEVERETALPYTSGELGRFKYLNAELESGAVIQTTNQYKYLAADRGLQRNFNLPLTGGAAYTHGNVNPTIDVEIPFYSMFRFVPGKWDNWTKDLFVAESDEGWCDNLLLQFSVNADNDNLHVIDMVAAGEDFQTYYYTGLPPMSRRALPVPAPNGPVGST